MVLLASGASKPISQIVVGDKVADAVPGGDGKTQVHTVERVIVTKTDHDFVDLTIATLDHAGRAGSVGKITSTDTHPFYDITQAAFIDAAHLKAGDRLQQPGDHTAIVLDIRHYHDTQTTYDLTIHGLHTYYVLAGTTPVLVHNACGEGAGAVTKYEDVTAPGARMPNRLTDVGPKEFGSNLEAGGWTRTDKGPNIMYEKDGARYFLRGKADSYTGWTADFYKAGSKKADLKIRLGED